MTDNNSKAPYPAEELADEALKRNFSQVAEVSFGLSEKIAADGSELMQGLAETHEQISDDYFAGGNEHTFLRDGKDLGKDDGFVTKT